MEKCCLSTCWNRKSLNFFYEIADEI